MNFQESLGPLNRGHDVLAFANDAIAADAKAVLLQAGFTEEDILSYSSAETPRPSCFRASGR